MSDSNKEVWKRIPNKFGVMYAVSSFGRVKRIANARTRKTGGVLQPAVGKRGYCRVQLYLDGEAPRFLVHRLVCFAFNGKPPSVSHVVNHIDGNPGNNYYKNLEWVTPSQNKIHSVRVLGKRPPSGKENSRAKHYVAVTPAGKRLKVHGLNEFCRNNNLSATCMSDLARGVGVCARHKGWECQYA